MMELFLAKNLINPHYVKGECGKMREKFFTGIKVSNRFSKVFDCIVHDLLRAELRAYGFDYNSVN